MPQRSRRGPGRRLVLTLAALASLIGGYYLGQLWQRQPLSDLSAIVYPNGKALTYPADIGLPDRVADDGLWRLFVVADSGAAACRELLRHCALVFNRLAYRPKLQPRLRLTLLAYDQPDAAARAAFAGAADWVEVISAPAATLDTLSGQLGIAPFTDDWCTPAQGNAILVAPDAIAWALIPYEQPAIMAHDIATIIDFVE